MRLAVRYSITLGTAVLLAACNGLSFDLDTIALAPGDAGWQVAEDGGGGSDSAEEADLSILDAATGADAGADAGNEPDVASPDSGSVDAGTDASTPPPECAIAMPVDTTTCNPTVADDCPQGGFCNLRFVSMKLQLLCSDSPQGSGTRGDSCTGTSDCADLFACFDWGIGSPDPRGRECSRYCELETNIGCEADEFCTSTAAVPDVQGYGWCTRRCDPYDAEACPEGQTCTIDFKYPDGTCHPEFRCANVTRSGAEGDACGSGAQTAECERGLSCYEVQAGDFRCVRPCEDDGICTGTSCGEPAGPWDLRFCS